MAIRGPKRKSKREQAFDARLGLIIDEMGQAMWNADRHHIAVYQRMTPHMEHTLGAFYELVQEHYGQKA